LARVELDDAKIREALGVKGIFLNDELDFSRLSPTALLARSILLVFLLFAPRLTA
jgi:hypothetical protein